MSDAPMAAPFRRNVVRVLSTGLGGLFILAAAGKMPALQQFSGTISSVTHFSRGIAEVLAVMIVAGEFLGGIALVFRFRIPLVSAFFCFLLALFLWVLFSAVVQGREIQCGCFGVLDVGLSNRAEAILDVVLFNLFLFLGFIAAQGRKVLSSGGKLALAGSMGALIILQVSVFGTLLSGSRSKTPAELGSFVSHFATRDPDFHNYTRGNRLLLLLSFPDFNCPPCFDSFLKVAEVAKSRTAQEESSRVLAVFKPSVEGDPQDSVRLKHWVAANGLAFPVLTAPDSLFRQIGFVKSSVVVLGPSGRVLFSEILPLRQERIERVSTLLQETYGQRH